MHGKNKIELCGLCWPNLGGSIEYIWQIGHFPSQNQLKRAVKPMIFTQYDPYIFLIKILKNKLKLKKKKIDIFKIENK